MQNAEKKDREVQTGWGSWKENPRAVRCLLRENGRGEKREERVGCDEILPFLTRVFSFSERSWSLFFALSSVAVHTDKVFYTLCLIKRFIYLFLSSQQPSPPLKRLLSGSEDYRPITILFIFSLCEAFPVVAGGKMKMLYVSQSPPTHLTRGSWNSPEARNKNILNTRIHIHLGIFLYPLPAFCSTPPPTRPWSSFFNSLTPQLRVSWPPIYPSPSHWGTNAPAATTYVDHFLLYSKSQSSSPITLTS